MTFWSLCQLESRFRVFQTWSRRVKDGSHCSISVWWKNQSQDNLLLLKSRQRTCPCTLRCISEPELEGNSAFNFQSSRFLPFHTFLFFLHCQLLSPCILPSFTWCALTLVLSCKTFSCGCLLCLTCLIVFWPVLLCWGLLLLSLCTSPCVGFCG